MAFEKIMSFSTKFINKENEVYILYFKYRRGVCTIHARKRLKTLNNVLLIYFKFIVIGLLFFSFVIYCYCHGTHTQNVETNI